MRGIWGTWAVTPKVHIFEIQQEVPELVGDGANDRFMLQNAGLAIAFSPKEILKEYSDGMITTDNLSGLRYFLGIPDDK